MRILLLTSTYPRWPGDGTPDFIARLSAGLAETHEVLALTPYRQDAPRMERHGNLAVRRFRYWWPRKSHRLGGAGGLLANVKGSLGAAVQAPALLASWTSAALGELRAWRPDVINAHWLVPGGLVGAIASGLGNVPLVTTAHGSDVALLERATPGLTRFVFSRSARLVANSGTTQRALEQLGLRAGDVPPPIERIPMGFEPVPRSAVREKYHGGVPFRLLSVGRLSSEKGHDLLLHAVAAVLVSRQPVTLTIVGGGPDLDRLHRLTSTLGLGDAVRFEGPQPRERVYELYGRHDALVLGSRREGQALVILEALSAGLPVIAGRVGVAPDVIRQGKNGLLVHPVNAPNLALAILQASEDPRWGTDAGRAALSTDLSEFFWPQVVGAYKRVLEDAGQRSHVAQ